ncbi:hypothetical protein JTB14_018910 [Gonioctena quinquepunctata]|nr:hypothetical protein JTB14_018910 [Gonioctena quinquepunctata]
MASFSLVGIMVYNGRRPEEIQRILILDFMESSQSSHDNWDSFRERPVRKMDYTRCVLRGKLGSEEIPLNDVPTNSNIQDSGTLNEENVISCTENSDAKTESDCTENNMEIEEIGPRRKRKLIDMSLGYVSWRSWTIEERNAVRYHFEENIECKGSPTLES